MKGPARVLAAALLLWAGAAEVRAGDTITGVCPDGSVFIVQNSADIPCREARQVDPQEVPPLKPQYLPRPYAWDVFRKQQDPNNPYNLVEAARRVREAGGPPPEAGVAGGAPPQTAGAGPGPELPGPHAPPTPPRTAAVQAPAPPPPTPDTGPRFSDQEIRDLYLIVELTQERSPARFDPEPERAVEVKIAHSRAFVSRLRQAGPGGARGPVLLFSAVAREPAAFHPNLTFVQGHQAFQPDAGDPAQLRLLHGAFGDLDPGEAVLGYVVLPEPIDIARPLDIYWNDRRISATLKGDGP